MNMLTISAAGFIIFNAMMIVALYVDRLIAQHLVKREATAALGAGLGALVH